MIVVCLLTLLLAIAAQQLSDCTWKIENQPEVFFVNMDKSVDRRLSMENHLASVGLLYRRVKGLTLNDIYFPKDVGSMWDKYESMIQTNEVIPAKGTPAAVHMEGFTHVMAGLVGRAKKNKLKEIGCTSSHLEAMRQAIYFNRTNSRYAIITEDDVQFPFNVDFEALAESAPTGFGILQLFNSNEESMQSLWNKYVQQRNLWTESYPKQAASFWSTCAYLIDREVMKPIIDKIAFEQEGFVHLKIVAGIKQPCRPKLSACCVYQNESMTFHFTQIPPCIWAAKGFQADSFIYSIARTFVLGVPLITNGAGGNQSTFHQDHVETIHQSAFTRQRQIINTMIRGEAPMPEFVTAACKTEIPTGMALKIAKKCNYYDWTKNSQSVAMHWINLDSDYKQRDNMNNYVTDTLFLQHRRVNAINASDLFLPQDVLRTWETRYCTFHSESVKKDAKDAYKYHMLEEVPTNRNKMVLVSGLCGRGRGQNTLGDLSVTVSHLLAMYQAVYHNPTANRYALIVEDDVHIPFDIDYEKMATAAPAGFGILRLVTGDRMLLERQWNKFLRNNSDLWSGQQSDKYYDVFATKAYVIDRVVMKQAIDTVMNDVTISTATTAYRKLLDFKIIAGLTTPCTPAECCRANSSSNAEGSSNATQATVFAEKSPCLHSRHGFQAERFLFKLAPTYVLNIPLVTGLLNGLHCQLRGEGKVEKGYLESVMQHKKYMDEFINERIPLPSFVKVGCNVALSS